MKKALLAFAMVLTLASVKAWAVTGDTNCNKDPNAGPVTSGVCPISSAAPDPASGQACGETEVIPGVLEVAGCANSGGVAGCIEIAETVGIGGTAASPIVLADCDEAANQACVDCGCYVCE